MGNIQTYALHLSSALIIGQVFEGFLLASILYGIILVLLIYANIRLLFNHPPTSQRPLDTLFIHAPLRFFLVMQLNLLFPLSLLCAIVYVLL